MLSQLVNDLENVYPVIDPIEKTNNEQNGNVLSDASLEEDKVDGNVLEDEDDDDLEEQDVEN